MQLVRQLFDIGYFVRALQVQMRFGELSRAPLRLLRLELEGDVVECDWMARAADEWDGDIPKQVNDKTMATQALQDAIAVRDLLFCSLPGIDSALHFGLFRPPVEGEAELIITGLVTRDQEDPSHVPSVAMRAKLLGFRFWLEDGILEALRSEDCVMSF